MKSKPAPGKMLTTAEMLPKTVDKINLAHLLDKLLHEIHTQKHTHACTHTQRGTYVCRHTHRCTHKRELSWNDGCIHLGIGLQQSSDSSASAGTLHFSL